MIFNKKLFIVVTNGKQISDSPFSTMRNGFSYFFRLFFSFFHVKNLLLKQKTSTFALAK